MRRLREPAWVGALALGLWLAWRAGFANYDTQYALVWGHELAHGIVPRYAGPLNPTPHPLAVLFGVLTAPLGDGAETAAVVVAFLALGWAGRLVCRLGAAWFGTAAGVLAAAVYLTREPLLSYGTRAYVDIPYVALVLAALMAETRRPRAGAPVLALLAAAGLLRPEAWLLSAAYVAWLGAGRGGRAPGELVAPALIALSAPAVWALGDLLVTGSPVHSLTGTRENVHVLGRVTGLQNVPLTMPRRLGEILREPVLLGAAGGGLLALAWARERARLLAGAGVAAVAAFCVLAAAGLPLVTRYLLLPAAILAVFCGAGALGWVGMPAGRRRRAWQVLGAVTAVALLAFVPAQARRLSRTRDSIALQQRIRDDLRAVLRAHPPAAACGPVSVPSHRPVPLVALVLDRRPQAVRDASLAAPVRGWYLQPADARVARNFILDPREPRPVAARVPPGFALVAVQRSWLLYRRCAPRAA